LRDRHPYPEDIFWLIEISDSTLAKNLAVVDLGIPEKGIRLPQQERNLCQQRLWLHPIPQQAINLHDLFFTTELTRSSNQQIFNVLASA
jgi:hypothetical protein